jgi:hypothetical protein
VEKVQLNDSEVHFGASNFSTTFGGECWRVYWISAGGDQGFLMELSGPGADVKAQAIVMILNASA